MGGCTPQKKYRESLKEDVHHERFQLHLKNYSKIKFFILMGLPKQDIVTS
jgi:hypothetical protein